MGSTRVQIPAVYTVKMLESSAPSQDPAVEDDSSYTGVICEFGPFFCRLVSVYLVRSGLAVFILFIFHRFWVVCLKSSLGTG